jgi:aconitate hydratase
MGQNVSLKLIERHLVDGTPSPGKHIRIGIDQTLTQDATGTMVMLEFAAMGISRVKTRLSAQYVDHNLLQTDYKNADDHIFLRSACRKFGIWFSRPGNGVSHPIHMERFAIPGQSLLGSDSHTPAAGSMGMLALGAGGIDVAMAMAGESITLEMPEIMGVYLTGTLPQWVSAKDVILEMLRRHGVRGGLGKIIEYHGPGLDCLSAMDRHVIANMGTELGATTTVFPSDEATRKFMRQQGREKEWTLIVADENADYDETDQIDLSRLEPLIALPSSPGNVVPVKEVAGRDIYQAYIGSSANPGFRDFAVPALMVEGRQVNDRVSFDVNPTSRQMLECLSDTGLLKKLIHAGARIHQAGCNGCIGMGQAPATGRISLRTVPRNFPGRSGTKEDQVYLCSPETATASALTGVITDPRTLGLKYHEFIEPDTFPVSTPIQAPPPDSGAALELEKGPNIQPLPLFDPAPEVICGPVLLKTGDDISTDEILPAGAGTLPFRSNIPEISKHVFNGMDVTFYERAMRHQQGFVIVAGNNYGQGSSREHAAISPRYLGLKIVVAKNFARIHRQNLISFGVLPVTFENPEDYDNIEQDDILEVEEVYRVLRRGKPIRFSNKTQNTVFSAEHSLTADQAEIILAGGLINLMRHRRN